MIDNTLIIGVAIALIPIIYGMIIQSKVNRTLKKMNKMVLNGGKDKGVTLAEKILKISCHSDIEVKKAPGEFIEQYYPNRKTLILSEPVYDGKTVDAIGTALHYVGEALQGVEGYEPFKKKRSLKKISDGSVILSVLLIFIGLFLGMNELACIGIILFGVVTLYETLMLPVKFNANKRVLEIIENNNIVEENDLQYIKKVMTVTSLKNVSVSYVAMAFLTNYIYGRKHKR